MAESIHTCPQVWRLLTRCLLAVNLPSNVKVISELADTFACLLTRAPLYKSAAPFLSDINSQFVVFVLLLPRVRVCATRLYSILLGQ
jgi:hypothetical protein